MARQQLRMLMKNTGQAIPPPALPAGYRLRQYRPEDAAAYIELMDLAGFAGWSGQRIEETRQSVLPGGFFLIEYGASGRLAATALAQRWPIDLLSDCGTLGWVAAAPAHRGRGLGQAVCAAATQRLLDEEFAYLTLLTDDHRLPAIGIYLRLGYRPWIPRLEILPRWWALEPRLRRHGLWL